MLKRYIQPIGLGLVGVLIGLSLVHAYADHQALHDIIRMINAAQQKPAPPAQ